MALVAALALYPHDPALQQPTEAQSGIVSAIVSIAVKLRAPMEKFRASNVIVLDLRGPSDSRHPWGKWLSDQIASALQTELPQVHIIDRAAVEKAESDSRTAKIQPGVIPSDRETARKLGADVLISGSFASYGQEIGISLQVTPVRNSNEWTEPVAGSVPITDELAAVSKEPLPELQMGSFKAGFAGISIPQCVRCPDPDFSDTARRAHAEGVVVLNVAVAADGSVTKVVTVKSPGYGLDVVAMDTVMTWKFRPAHDWKGNAVPVIVPVEVSFKLLHNR